MLDHKSLRFAVLMLIMLTLSACVSKSTFENMAAQAKKLDTDLTDLQSRHQALVNREEELQASHADLQKRQNELQAAHQALSQEKVELEKENAGLLAQNETLAAGNRELEEILAAREDSLTRKIAEQRQEMTGLQSEYEIKLNELNRQLAELAGKRAALEAELGVCEQTGAQQNKQLAELGQQLAVARETNNLLNEDLQLFRAEKESEVQAMSATYQSLLDKMKNEIDQGQITISELKGKLTVNMIDAILFDSGKAEIKEGGLQVLQKVIDILREIPGKTIRIEGHTDNVPIVGALAQRYPTNWELSAARAVNVTRFLQERGLDPRNLNAVAYGEYLPVADNDTDAGRARNRRIEIILAEPDRH